MRLKRIGIRTSAILFGRYDVAMVMAFHALFVLTLAVVGWVDGRGACFYAGLLLTAVLAAWQYRWIRSRTREGCFRAFRHNNWLGGVVFAGIVADYAFPVAVGF